MANRRLKSNSVLRTGSSALCLVIAAPGALLGMSQTKGEGLDQVKTQTTPYYYRVKALNKAEWTRLHTLAIKVRGARVESKELPEGYAFRLRSDQIPLADLGEWTSYVHRCCPFLDYEIVANRDGALWLNIKGGEEAKPFIRSEFARLFVP